MLKRTTINRNWLGITALLALALVLGLRSKHVATEILAAESIPTDVVATTTTVANDELETIVQQESVLAELTVEERNPFIKPEEKKKTRQRVRRRETAPAPKKIEPPRLLTLLFDSVNPCVQISVAGDRSGWMHVGDEFQGWKVDDIAAKAVTVSLGEERHVLR